MSLRRDLSRPLHAMAKTKEQTWGENEKVSDAINGSTLPSSCSGLIISMPEEISSSHHLPGECESRRLGGITSSFS